MCQGHLPGSRCFHVNGRRNKPIASSFSPRTRPAQSLNSSLMSLASKKFAHSRSRSVATIKRTWNIWKSDGTRASTTASPHGNSCIPSQWDFDTATAPFALPGLNIYPHSALWKTTKTANCLVCICTVLHSFAQFCSWYENLATDIRIIRSDLQSRKLLWSVSNHGIIHHVEQDWLFGSCCRTPITWVFQGEEPQHCLPRRFEAQSSSLAAAGAPEFGCECKARHSSRKFALHFEHVRNQLSTFSCTEWITCEDGDLS